MVHINAHYINRGIYLLTLVIRFMGGFTTALFVVKIKDEDETLEAWNFILNSFKPSYADLVKKLFGSLDIGYSYGSQPQKCQNDVFLENRVPIDRFP